MTSKTTSTSTIDPAAAKAAIERAVKANEGVFASRAAEAGFKRDRLEAIADARMAGAQVSYIAAALIDPDTGKPMSAARVQQLALKVLGERGVKAPRGGKRAASNGKASDPTPRSKAAASRAGKATPAPKPSARKRASKTTASKTTAASTTRTRKAVTSKAQPRRSAK